MRTDVGRRQSGGRLAGPGRNLARDSRRLRRAGTLAVVAAALCLAGLAAASPAGAAPPASAAVTAGPLPPPTSSLQEISDFGPNPTGLRMYLYVPQRVRPHPAVVVALHYCGGSGRPSSLAPSLPPSPTDTASWSCTRL